VRGFSTDFATDVKGRFVPVRPVVSVTFDVIYVSRIGVPCDQVHNLVVFIDAKRASHESGRSGFQK